MFVDPICIECKYYTKNTKCKAYPRGIPNRIAFRDIKHNKVFKDQIGTYIFKEKSKTTKGLLEGQENYIESLVGKKEVSDYVK